MLTLRDRTSDGRDAGFDRRHARRRTRNVLLLTDAGIAPDLREAQRLALVDQAPLGHRELLLEAAQLEVVARHFRRHAHAHIVDVGLEALGVAAAARTCERTRPNTSISQNASKPARYVVMGRGRSEKPGIA